jgi:hypothetical protein
MHYFLFMRMVLGPCEFVAQWYLVEDATPAFSGLLYLGVLCFADHAAGVLIK